jgi:hypothetical protein
MINDPEYQIWELQGVLVREEYKLPWVPLAEMPGFEGMVVTGVDGKYFGKDELGPFAYLIRLAPGAIFPARAHRAVVMRFMLSGSCTAGSRQAGAGWFEYKSASSPVSAMHAGADGCLCMEVYQTNPRTTLAADVPGASP